MQKMMRKNFACCLRLNFQLTLAYFSRYIKEEKARRILMNTDDKSAS